MPSGEKVMGDMNFGLKLLDQFHDLALRFTGKTPQPRSGIAEQAGDQFQVTNWGQTTAIPITQLNLNEWDDTRYQALERRVKIAFDLFRELYSEEPGLPLEEWARIKVRMDRIKEELCEDFKVMVKIYELTLGISLPDHYTLYEICNP
jgi:hypothetical protein